MIQDLLLDILNDAKLKLGTGRVVDFIPALAEVKPNSLGFSMVSTTGETWNVGDAHVGFSIQSISKAIAYIFAMTRGGEDLTLRVRREAAGHKFNSLIRLEEELGIPRNPFVNGGALVVSDIVHSLSDRPQEDVLEFVRDLAGNQGIVSDKQVSDCEYELGDRNTAIAYLLKSFGNLNGSVEDVLRLYFHNCALSMSCQDLARFFGFLANDGVCPTRRVRIVSVEQARALQGLLSVCGLYEESGDFFCRVGVPTKSGVGGGIVGVIPGRYSFCVWSPELNEHGNSVAGLHVIEKVAGHFLEH